MAYSDEVLADSPYLYWRLDDTSGTTAADASGNARTGTYSGTPTLVQAPLINAGNSVLFDDTDDYCLSVATVNLSTCTVEVWFDYDGTPPASGEQWFVAGFNQGDGGGVGDKHILIDDANFVRFYVYDGSGQTALSANPISAGIHHLVGVIDDPANTAYIYVDGVQDGTVAAASSFAAYSGPNVLVAGESGAIGTIQRKAGRRDEFAVYDTALSPARIAAHYIAGIAAQTEVLVQRHVFGHGVW